MKIAGKICLICLFCFAVTNANALKNTSSVPDPEKPGKYPVGVTTVLLVDHERQNIVTDGPRCLMTEIWYPAADETRDLPRRGLMDTYFLEIPDAAFGLIKAITEVDLREFDHKFEFSAVRDARIRDGRFPLILFSHGSVATRCQSLFWCEHMASHGYIVAAPDHTGNAIVTFIDGKPVTAKDRDMEDFADVRPRDLMFVLDKLTRMEKGADSRFMDKIDLDNVGVSGHSYGGYTAVEMADREPRVDAIAPMAGVCLDRTNLECPALVLLATEDDILGLDRNDTMRGYYRESKGPRYFVEFLNAGHFTFTEIGQIMPDFGDGIGKGKRVTNGEPLSFISREKALPLINGYTTAFFGKYLKGLDAYDFYLEKNQDPAELVVKWSVP